jgi:hypothetical protein
MPEHAAVVLFDPTYFSNEAREAPGVTSKAKWNAG